MAEPGTPHADGGTDWRSLHLWQIQPLRDVLVIAVVLGVLYLGYLVSIVTVPLLLATLLAYLFEPVVKRMTRVSWMSRQMAAAIIVVVAAVVVVVPAVVATAFAVTQGVAFAGRVSGSVERVYASVQNPEDADALAAVPEGFWLATRDFLVERRDVTEGEVAKRLLELVRANAQTIATQALETGAGAVGATLRGIASVFSLVFGAFLTAFFFFFVCTGWGKVLEFWEGLIPERKRGRWLELVRAFDAVVSGFVRGRLTIAFIQAGILSVLYWVIGTPAPILFGLAIGLLSIVPYLALIGIPATIVAMWLDPSGPGWQNAWWWVTFAPMVVYFIAQAADDYVLTPMIQGKSTGMDTPSILFASLAGGALFGFYGLLIAIPLAACVKILLKEVFWPRFRAWAEGRERDFLPVGRE